MNTIPGDLKWFVVYTRPKAERKVASSMAEMGLDSYLPLCKVMRQWSDRRKMIEIPLFPNYVFVKATDSHRGKLFTIKELVKFVLIDKKPAVIRDSEIDSIKKVLDEGTEVGVGDYFQEGMRVKLTTGRLAGVEGVVIKQNNHSRLLIRIDGLMRAISINVPAGDVEEISEKLKSKEVC
jgi:transcription antitermination factor NusG